MKDEPAFDEVLAYGRAIRHADRPPEDPGHEVARPERSEGRDGKPTTNANDSHTT
jgi:hypothetical protein